MSECCYLCNECPMSFPSLADLEEHLKEAMHEKTETAKEIKQEQRSEREIASVPIMDSDSLGSPLSSSDLSSVATTPNHEIMCRLCSRSFPDRDQLNVHYTHTHRDKPQYMCEHCNEMFSVKRELSTHMRIHSGEEPHRCELCGKEFGTRQLLKKHYLVHSGNRSHACPHCDKAFYQKGHLTQHLMIHTGERPHRCDLCEKTFIFKFDLNRHMKIHAEKGHWCRRCDQSFADQLLLNEHHCKHRKRPKSSTSPNSVISSPIAAAPPEAATDPMAFITQLLIAQQQQRLLSDLRFRQTLQMSPLFCTLCSINFDTPEAFALHSQIAHSDNMSNYPKSTYTPPMECNSCIQMRTKFLEMERALNEAKNESNRLKEVILRFNGLAQLMGPLPDSVLISK